MNTLPFFNFVLNAVIFIVFLLFSKSSLEKIRNILTILDEGGYSNCPYYIEKLSHGDDFLVWQKSTEKGGE